MKWKVSSKVQIPQICSSGQCMSQLNYFPPLVLCTDKAPLSKGLLLVLNGLTVMLTLLPQYQDLFVYNLQAVTQQHQVCLHSPGMSVCDGGERLKPTPTISRWCVWLPGSHCSGLDTNRHKLLKHFYIVQIRAWKRLAFSHISWSSSVNEVCICCRCCCHHRTNVL